MQLRFRVRLFVLIAGLVSLLIVACGGDAPSAAPSAATTSTVVATAAPTVVVVAVTPTVVNEEPAASSISAGLAGSEPAMVTFKVTDRSIEAPEFIPAGLTTIRLENAGSVQHSMVVFDIDDGHTVGDVALELTGQNWPEAWAPSVGQITAEAGETSEWTILLKQGLYAATDWTSGPDLIPHVARGVFTGFEVIASESSAVAWDSGAVEIGLLDFAFAGIKDLTAGRTTFHVVNKSDVQDHEMAFVRLEDGQSVGELLGNYRVSPVGEGESPEAFGRIGWVGPGQEVEYSVDFDAGRYGVICLLPDSHPGTPHWNLGMLGEFTVE